MDRIKQLEQAVEILHSRVASLERQMRLRTKPTSYEIDQAQIEFLGLERQPDGSYAPRQVRRVDVEV